MKDYIPIDYGHSPLDAPGWLKYGYMLCGILFLALVLFIIYNEYIHKVI